MKSEIYLISNWSLIISLLPIILVIIIYWRWTKKPIHLIHATSRMILQLIGIGFVLTYIFNGTKVWPIIIILMIMAIAASKIAIGPIKKINSKVFLLALLSLVIVVGLILSLIIFVIIIPTPWYQPTYLIPLAGMLFSNSMNGISLAGERFYKELSLNTNKETARIEAWKTSLIPIVNSYFAVGLVSLPGMMTGQILAGVDPLLACRYQILIMTSLFGASGLCSALFLTFLYKDLARQN